MTTPPVRATEVVVDLAAVRHNVATIASTAGAPVCAVVKADAYGHGALPVARAALDAGAAWLAVATVEEAEELRAGGIDAPTMLFSEPPLAGIERLLAADLVPPLYSHAFGAALDRAGRERGRPVTVHLCVDSGMGRVGVQPAHLPALLEAAAGWDGVHVDGLWTHLARSDEPTQPTTDEQLDRFDVARQQVADAGFTATWTHAANTAGALLHPRAAFDLVRPGIGVYGLSPAAEVDAADHGLRPALTLTTEVRWVKRIAAGTPVSYGHRWSAPADGWLATLQVGYADGVPRLLTNDAWASHVGVRRPVVGTVTMDAVHLWCGDDEPTPGDVVELLGGDGPRVEDWAATVGTITYEITCGLGARLPRRHVDSDTGDARW
jgi:alanine racemase